MEAVSGLTPSIAFRYPKKKKTKERDLLVPSSYIWIIGQELGPWSANFTSGVDLV